MSEARLAVPPGDHVVDDEQLREVFIAALEAQQVAGSGYVMLERWQDLVRDPATKGLEFVWRWHLQVIGKVQGYASRELLLDLAVPLRPGTGDASHPDRLAARGRAAELLGIGAPEPVHEQAEEEDKVIDLPVQQPVPTVTLDASGLDPNTLFPGVIDRFHAWLVRLYLTLRGPNYPFGPDDPAADARAAAADAPTAEPVVSAEVLAAEDAGPPVA